MGVDRVAGMGLGGGGLLAGGPGGLDIGGGGEGGGVSWIYGLLGGWGKRACCGCFV